MRGSRSRSTPKLTRVTNRNVGKHCLLDSCAGKLIPGAHSGSTKQINRYLVERVDYVNLSPLSVAKTTTSVSLSSPPFRYTVSGRYIILDNRD